MSFLFLFVIETPKKSVSNTRSEGRGRRQAMFEGPRHVSKHRRPANHRCRPCQQTNHSTPLYIISLSSRIICSLFFKYRKTGRHGFYKQQLLPQSLRSNPSFKPFSYSKNTSTCMVSQTDPYPSRFIQLSYN
jgi:hypothetical protein